MNKYIAEDIKQKLINPYTDFKKMFWLNWKENNNDAKTSKFLDHCIGLIAWKNEIRSGKK